MKSNNIFIYILMVAIIVLIFRECQHVKETNNLLFKVAAYSDTAKTYKSEHGDMVSYNQSLEFQNKKQLKDNISLMSSNEALKSELKNWKDVSSLTTVATSTVIKHDTITLVLVDTIPCYFEPIIFSKNTDNYSVFGRIKPSSILLDSLIVPNMQSIVVGEKKVGMFKKEKRVEIYNSNPLIQTTHVGSYVISDKKKWYQTTIFKFGVGFVAGVLVNSATSKKY